MASINKVILIGRLGKDPQISTFQNGGKIATFSVATSDRWTDKQTGEKKERTEWHNVVINSPVLAAFAEKYLQKGNNVYIEGKLQTREWTDQNGTRRYVTEVIVAPYGGQLISLDSKLQTPACDVDSSEASETYPEFEDSDIPF